MKLFLASAIFILGCSTLSAQTREECIKELNKIARKSVNQKFLSGIFYEKAKLKAQEFSETEISKVVQTRVTMKTRYTNIDWNSLSDYSLFNYQSMIVSKDRNDKLLQLTLKFKKNVKHEYFGADDAGDDDPRTDNEIDEIYILEKYRDDAEKYVKRLIELAQE